MFFVIKNLFFVIGVAIQSAGVWYFLITFFINWAVPAVLFYAVIDGSEEGYEETAQLEIVDLKGVCMKDL